MRHDTAEDIRLARNAEALRALHADQSIVGHEIERAAITGGRFVFAAVFVTLECGEPLSNPRAACPLVRAFESRTQAAIAHDRAAHVSLCGMLHSASVWVSRRGDYLLTAKRRQIPGGSEFLKHRTPCWRGQAKPL